jgi:hypothetical protein
MRLPPRTRAQATREGSGRPRDGDTAAGSKFNVQGKGQLRDQQGVLREFLIKPEMFK